MLPLSLNSALSLYILLLLFVCICWWWPLLRTFRSLLQLMAPIGTLSLSLRACDMVLTGHRLAGTCIFTHCGVHIHIRVRFRFQSLHSNHTHDVSRRMQSQLTLFWQQFFASCAIKFKLRVICIIIIWLVSILIRQHWPYHYYHCVSVWKSRQKIRFYVSFVWIWTLIDPFYVYLLWGKTYVQPSASPGLYVKNASKNPRSNSLCVPYEQEGGISWLNDKMVVRILLKG